MLDPYNALYYGRALDNDDLWMYNAEYKSGNEGEKYI